ncbi:MAG: NAD(P)/FAD-dependent oxidoreductase [Cyanobium sp.]
MPVDQVDILVAGAGPSGAVASFLLAQSGKRVLLLDRVNSAAPKVGETLAPMGAALVRRLGLGHLLEPPHHPIRGQISLWDGRGEQTTDFFATIHGPAWRLDRPRFDAGLRRAAVAAGVVLVEGHVDALNRETDGWCVASAGRLYRCRRLIDATGRRAWIARRLGARIHHDDDQVALYGLWRPATPILTDRTLVERCPDGCWWYGARLPDGRAIAGLHLPGRAAMRMRRNLDGWNQAYATTRLIQRHLGSAAFPSLLTPQIATGSVTTLTEGDGWQAIGDAAMAFDPISGFGLQASIQDSSWLAEGVDDRERSRRRSALRTAYRRSMFQTKG